MAEGWWPAVKDFIKPNWASDGGGRGRELPVCQKKKTFAHIHKVSSTAPNWFYEAFGNLAFRTWQAFRRGNVEAFQDFQLG